jgi:hypothetical protein
VAARATLHRQRIKTIASLATVMNRDDQRTTRGMRGRPWLAE